MLIFGPMIRVLLLAAFSCTANIFAQIVQDTAFVEVSRGLVLDMKYATDDNFLGKNVYGCAKCLLRNAAAEALLNANETFVEKGYRIKVFDCYRPIDVQQKMWALVPNPVYVADPKKGSIHNRGAAVDITLVDASGKELDMGTGFDHFGPKSAHGYKKLPSRIRKNRKLLRRIMEAHGFKAFESEWWHYNLAGASALPLANKSWDCD